MKNSANDSNYQLHVIFALVIITGVLMIYAMLGGFNMTNQEKIDKIEECTAKNYGVIFTYNMSSMSIPHKVTCCIKGEQYCNFEYLNQKQK